MEINLKCIYITVSKDDIRAIKYTYPDGNCYILSRRESKWYKDNTQSDSSVVDEFLNSLRNVYWQDFNDTFKPELNPDYKLLIEGNNLLNISVKGYKGADGEIIINSSLNPGIYFNSKPEGVFGMIFKSKRDFI